MPPPTTTSITHALDLADARHWTCKPPTRPATRLRYLLNAQDPDVLAARIFAYPAAVERWAQGDDLDHLTTTHAHLIEREIYPSWQPHTRHRAHHQILDHDGCVTARLHARFTYTTPHGEFPDERLRNITEDLPTAHARLLFDARHAESDDDELRRILADGIGETYFFRALPRDQQQAAVTISDLHLIQSTTDTSVHNTPGPPPSREPTLTHIYAFQDTSGQWHGDPDAAPANPADEPSHGWLTYQPISGTPEADSPFAGQTLAVLYGVTDLEPGPVIYQLDSGGRFQATWYVHALLATPIGSAVIPPQRHDHAPAPCLEGNLTENDRHYALTATRDANGQLATEITVTSHDGEIQAELRGTLNIADISSLARLLHPSIPNPAPPAVSRRRTWSLAESNRLAARYREEGDFGVLAQEFNCRRGDIYLHLRDLELIADPAQRRPRQPAQPQPAPTTSPVLQQRRLQYSNSHARWTEPEEVQLARRCAEGAPVAELSQEFGRSELAIESRLLKIGAHGPAADQARLNVL